MSFQYLLKRIKCQFHEFISMCNVLFHSLYICMCSVTAPNPLGKRNIFCSKCFHFWISAYMFTEWKLFIAWKCQTISHIMKFVNRINWHSWSYWKMVKYSVECVLLLFFDIKDFNISRVRQRKGRRKERVNFIYCVCIVFIYQMLSQYGSLTHICIVIFTFPTK